MDISKVTAGAPLFRQILQLRVGLAFAAIYLLWGATFLAIRIAVQDLPPFFAGGVRFLIAGGVLYLFMRLRGRPSPTVTEWGSIAIIAICMFVATYGALFWAEQYVASGLASVIEATLPITTMTLEVLVFRRQRFHWRMGAAVLLGFLGVAWLLLRSDQRLLWWPCLVILAAGAVWSLGAILSRTVPRPQSLVLAAGAQMLLGGVVLLLLSLGSGELRTIPHITSRAAVALVYLIIGGSLLGFTAYVWLLTRMPATRVASHAYVNPLVALALGYFIAHEPLGLRTMLGATLVVASVFLILTAPQVAVHNAERNAGRHRLPPQGGPRRSVRAVALEHGSDGVGSGAARNL
jgi:drug/metabolite transporter (DMT)-like permease